MLERFEPGTAYRPLVNDSFYGSRLRQLAAVKLRIVATQAKFKLGPAGPVAIKRRVVERLRERREPNDGRAADVIEASLPRE